MERAQARRDVTENRRRLLLSAAALACLGAARPALAAQSGATPAVQVAVERHGATLVVQAQADVAATQEQAFATLIDYDHLPEFIPDLLASRTLVRDGSNALVEQRGRASFGPFHQSFTLRLAVEETPGVAVHASLAGSEDFRRFDATYELAGTQGHGMHIAYHAVLEPSAGVPPLIGVSIMRKAIRRQFEALVAEIARRGAAG